MRYKRWLLGGKRGADHADFDGQVNGISSAKGPPGCPGQPAEVGLPWPSRPRYTQKRAEVC